MVRSSKRSGHSPFKAVMLGSSPARITITMGYSQVAKAPVFDTGIVGSSPAIPAMIRYSSGSRGQTANLLVAGSNPARISIWSLRLVGQDASLSSWRYGFESRKDHQTVRHIGVYQLVVLDLFPIKLVTTWIIKATPNPTTPPAKIMNRHSS